MAKKKQPPLTLIVAESDDLRVVQTGPGRFVLERAALDATGVRSWRRVKTDLLDTGEVVSLLRGTKGMYDIRAPWQVALTDWPGLLVLVWLALILGFSLAHFLGVSPS